MELRMFRQSDAAFASSNNFLTLKRPGRSVSKSADMLTLLLCAVSVGTVLEEENIRPFLEY